MSQEQKQGMWLVVGLAGLITAGPFLLTLAGDAQVHLAIAERFVDGEPFRYNPGGELVVASTSPFWTLLLVLYYLLVGAGAPLLLKMTGVVVWLATAVLLYRLSRKTWHFSEPISLAVTALWLAHTVVVANALNGLENGLGALQLLWLYRLTLAGHLTRRRAAGMGLLLGWALLTRPDVGLFALLLVGALLGWQRQDFVANLPAAATHFLLLAGLAALVLLPWYGYQFSVTGKLVTDSSVARLYTGRQGALPLLGGWLYFHPKALLSLAAAFLPLGIGIVGLLVSWWVGWRKGERALFAQGTAVLLVGFGLLFFSLGVGAEAFGRYFLPLYPFFFLAGVAGLVEVAGWIKRWRETAVRPFIGLVILFLLATSGYDYYRRLGPGRFVPDRTLDVIYGPANLQYYSANLFDLVNAPAQRKAATDQLLADLQASNLFHATIAVTEVQLRYFVDERVKVLSLDGRTSANILDYFDRESGVPDFAAYFRATRPDFVHVNQWCAVGGWLASLRPATITPNLVCQWQQQTAQMALGEQFDWDSNRVQLVAPEIVRIFWNNEK